MRAALVVVSLGLAVVATTAGVAHQPLPAREPAFETIQRELFAVPGSLSNAWADVDNDGHLDLAVSLRGGEIRLYLNRGEELVSLGAAMGLPTSGGEFRGLSWGDYDDDGWIDLFAGSSLPDEPSALFHNLGGKRFADVADDVGLAMPGRSSRQNNWIDYDNDGDLDLYATDRRGANKLYRNDGPRFTHVFATGGPIDARATVGACWLDYDRDGDLDLFLANQAGQTDALWRNDGEVFVDVAPDLGMHSPGRAAQEGSVGCAVGDYDRDGNLDIFVPNYGRNALWRGTSDGKFSNVAAAMGVDVENHAVGAAWGDYDNDGHADLAVMSYEGPVGGQVPRNRLFHNESGRRFVNVLAEGGPLDVGDHGVAWVDYDRDGALDLSVTRGYGPVGGHFLFRNLLSSAASRQSLQVTVLDGDGRFTQAGAEVRVYDSGGDLLGTGQVATGGGYGAQGATPVHFGLLGMKQVTVEVTFLSASGRKAQRLENVSLSAYAGTALVVRRGF